MSNHLTVLSLYTGAGGLDYGFEAAGFVTRVALELDPISCSSLRASRPWPVIEADILKTPTSVLLDTGSLRMGNVDVVIGGPPCQPFSKSGWWASGDSLRLDDPRAGTLHAYLRVVKETRPKAFLLENVEGLTFQGKDEAVALLLSAIDRINATQGTEYRPTVVTLNAADYGVPQTRTRVFIVASRDGRPFVAPRQTHFSADVPLDDAETWRTAWDAIGNMSEPTDECLAISGKWADLLPSIPEGHNYLWHTDRMGGAPLFGWRRRYWNFLLKLAKNRPAWTIQAQPGPATGPFHWQNRRLSSGELMRLQTFPKDVVVKGGQADVQKQLGNAVPSLLGEVMARAMTRQFFDRTQCEHRPSLLPPKANRAPPPESVVPVPSKYLSLVGKHEPHPGTRQGFLYAK